MKEFSLSQVCIKDSFWTSRLRTNARVAIFHQWQQLEQSHCIDNFRIAAGEKNGLREGWFFSDSDAYKWLDAAVRITINWPSNTLQQLMNDFIDLIGRTQGEDGYIYTYNQVHFPGERWSNLMIEHELYCLGHLIEAGISHNEATGQESLLMIATKAADLLVKEFLIGPPEKTSGHEEIEIALLRLYQHTHQISYLELAREFLERRGRDRLFSFHLLQQNARVARRNKVVQKQRQMYMVSHPDQEPTQLPPDNFAKIPPNIKFRWAINVLSGKYFQQHRPIRKQTAPVGHSVRFSYLQTALAMVYRWTGEEALLSVEEKIWEHMLQHRSYITGGIGSLPVLEGFGRDDELDPEFAYAETCAAIGSLFWNWEMTLATKDPRYSDFFEWQLYNAVSVGMGLKGDSYLYNNPLLVRDGITRRPWFRVPCCPSNLSRTWASLGKYIYSYDDKNLWVHQYIGNETRFDQKGWKVNLRSDLPWKGRIRFSMDLPVAGDFTVYFRIPSWAGSPQITINGEPCDFHLPVPPPIFIESQLANSIGVDPRQAHYLPIRRVWNSQDVVQIYFNLPITLRYAPSQIKGHTGKVALTRGPLVYCLESTDNIGFDILNCRIVPASLHLGSSPSLLGGIHTVKGKTSAGEDFTAIPYFLWGNRGPSRMTVWLNT